MCLRSTEMSRQWFFLSITMAVLACNTPVQPKAKPKKSAPVSTLSMSEASPEPVNVPASDHYGVPFAWEKADDEPLGQTRNYLSEVIQDNQGYSRHGREFFEKLIRPETPRATVVACSDSVMQTDAWDSTPENDDFIIRNLGNQVTTSLGSIQYGVEQLNTPVLLILGHTGCGAIKAVMDHAKGHPPELQKELDAIKISAAKSDTTEELAWAQAAVVNVHHQVRIALDKFGPRVVTGKLTVVGALCDLRNALRNGYAAISIININGNSTENRVQAFVAAIQDSHKTSSAQTSPQGPRPAAGQAPAATAAADNAPDFAAVEGEDLNSLLANIPGLVAKDGARAPH